jgi:drug/metabolite transporter (DMT)-like permease
MSILTSILYALVFSVFLFGQEVQWLYFLGYGFVVVGILLYNYVSGAKISELSEELKGQEESA